MKRNDILLLCGVIVIAAIIFAICFAVIGNGGAYAVITVDGEEYARLPLNEDSQLEVITQYGKNTVTVKDGKVSVTDADCPDKICVSTGTATELKTVVCLPHKLTVSVEEAQ